MQEVKGYLDGERNYLNLYGDTGPLVYPAGFLYVFSGLRWLTKEGTDILTGKHCISTLDYLFYFYFIKYIAHYFRSLTIEFQMK